MIQINKYLILAMMLPGLFLFSCSGEQAHQQQMNDEQMTEMLGNSEMRGVVMQRMNENPEMRREMIRHMMSDSGSRQEMMQHMLSDSGSRHEMMQHVMADSLQMNRQAMGDRMQSMMQDPGRRAEMTEHMRTMLSVLEQEPFDAEELERKMQESDMMRMHMMCLDLSAETDD
jgi:hypothetical protein